MAPHGPRMVNDGRPAQAAVAGPRTRTRRGPRTHPSSYPHPHTHAPHRIRTAIDIDLRKSFQTEMISPPFHPRLFWSLVFSVRINQFRGIFTAKMRLVRLFPDACNGDVTCITQHFGPYAERFWRDLLLKRASRVSVPDRKFPAHNILVRTRSDFSAICC